MGDSALPTRRHVVSEFFEGDLYEFETKVVVQGEFLDVVDFIDLYFGARIVSKSSHETPSPKPYA